MHHPEYRQPITLNATRALEDRVMKGSAAAELYTRA